MGYKKFFELFHFILPVFCVGAIQLTDFSLSDSHIRYARLRCWQQFPQAELVNYTDTYETHCYLHCFLKRIGLMDLSTRGLDSEKFIDVWEQIEEAFKEDTCLERFDFSEPLSGNCSDSYRKLMELRDTCVELFEYTFNTNSIWKHEVFKHGKTLGQSAAEFCDLIENSEDEEVSLLAQYKVKLECIFENILYLDAYGRVDESEINLSYQEAQEDSAESQATVRTCAHRANSKFQPNYLGSLVLELEKCLKTHSRAFNSVFKLRDETSRQY